MSILKIVVVGLLIALVVALIGVIIMVLQSTGVPNEFWILVSSIVTGLLGLLAPSKDATNPNT